MKALAEPAKSDGVAGFRSRGFAGLMAGFAVLDLWSHLHRAAERFSPPLHLPYYWLHAFSPKAEWIASLLFDLWLLYTICFGFVPVAQSKAERAMYCSIFAVLSIPPLRYFLPRLAPQLWWVQVGCITLTLVSALVLYWEIGSQRTAVS